MAYKVKDDKGKEVIVKGSKVMGQDDFSGEIKDFSNRERSFVAVANQESPDRMGDTILVRGWSLDNYRKNPVVMSFHNYSQLPVGRSLEEFKRTRNGIKQLAFRPQFAVYPETMRMYEMYRDGYLKGFSVGFVPLKSERIEEDGDNVENPFMHIPTRFLKTELLEVSVAPIPAHPDALSEIRSLVKKGGLYIPARYLKEEDEPEVETYDEYVHIRFAEQDEFFKLYERTVDDMIVVFGKKADENEFFLFKVIGPVSKFGGEVPEELKKEVDELIGEVQKEQVSDDPPALNVFDPVKYEAKDTVMVDLPELDEEQFVIEVEDKDLDEEETEEKEEDEANIDIEALELELKDIMDQVKGELKQLNKDGIEEGDIKEYDDGRIGVCYEGEWIMCDPITKDEFDAEVKPYPNEHACRLNDPGKYDKFARKNCYRKSDDKCVDYIFGISGGKSELQAMRYPKEAWKASVASAHCKTAGGTFEAAGKEKAINEELVDKLIERFSEVSDKQFEGLIERLEELETAFEGLEEFVRSSLNEDEDDDGEYIELDIQEEEKQIDDNDFLVELEDEPEDDYDEDAIDRMLERALMRHMPGALGRLDD